MAEKFISIEDAKSNLLDCATFLAERIKSADGHADSIKAILPYYIENNSVDLAAGLADSVADPFVRDRLLTLVAEKCAATDDDEYAFQLAEAIEDLGMQEAALERIALQKAIKGDFEKALEIAGNLQHPSNALADIAAYQAAQGNEEKAQETLDSIDFPNAEVHARQIIAHQYLQKDENVKALEMLDDAVEAALEIEFNEEKYRALVEISNLYLEAKRNDKGIETLDKAKAIAESIEGGHRDSLLVNVSLGFLKAGSLELADRTLDIISDKTQISTCLAGFAQHFWTRDEKDEALETLEEAYAILKSQGEREIRDSRARYALFANIAVQFAQFEKPERAIEIAQNIEEENEQMSALARIAQILVLQEKDELAGQALQAIAVDSNRMFALIGMSNAKNKLGEKEAAINLLNEAAHLAETVPQFTSRSAAYNEVAKRFLEYGEQETARQAAHENLEVITQIRDDNNRVVALASLAEFYKKANFELNDSERELLLAMIRRVEF
jgi:tetratricopeptide (TPR) repeat protein